MVPLNFVISFDLISILFIAIFLLPVVAGITAGFTRDRVYQSFTSMLENLELAGGIIFAVYLTSRIFYNQGEDLFKKVYGVIPTVIRDFLTGKDILVYMLSVPIILLLTLSLIRLVTVPLYKKCILPFSERFYIRINAAGGFMRRIVGGLWELPRSILFVLLFALVLNFASYFTYSPALSKNLTDSILYRFIYDNALNPVLNSNFARKIPVIVNDSFKKAAERFIPRTTGDGSNATEPLHADSDSRIRVIEYFNGVTLEDAVKSNVEIDSKALSITSAVKDDKRKTYLLYSWIAKNIKYDYDKAARIASNPSGISSGSIIAFNERKGVCFDYSCLFISMCRAIGLKSRLITGLGYSGSAWGDHTWNQVYYYVEKRWINVDPTFGSSGLNYFDKSDFETDHKFAEIQGEW